MSEDQSPSPIPSAQDDQRRRAIVQDAIDNVLPALMRPGRDVCATARECVFTLNEALSRPVSE